MGGKGSGALPMVLGADTKELILKRLSEGKTLKSICEEIQLDPQTLFRIKRQDASFSSLFSEAQSDGYDILAESLLNIPDEYEDVNKARLKSDNVKWMLARRAHAKYGDRIDLNVTQTVDIKSALLEARERTKFVVSEVSSASEVLEAPKVSEVSSGAEVEASKVSDLLS